MTPEEQHPNPSRPPSQPTSPWRPWRLQVARLQRGFTSQRKLAIASGVDQQTINRVEAGANVSEETSERLAHYLQLSPHALYIAHNLAIVTDELARGYRSLAQAKRDRNYLENVIHNVAATIPPDQASICAATLDELNHVIYALQAAHQHHPPGDNATS